MIDTSRMKEKEDQKKQATATNGSEAEEIEGTVIEALPETLFKVMLDDGQETMAYLAGKMKIRRIRVLVGDRVLMKTDPYGGKARIFRRL
jgi:translation initiation factor IF-1